MSDFLPLEQRMRMGGLQTAIERYRSAVKTDIEDPTPESIRKVIRARDNYEQLKKSYRHDYPEIPS